MLATVQSSTLVGIDPLDIHVEVDVSPGLPTFEIVGLPGTAVREARDRVRTALKNSDFHVPPGRVTINLAPAHVPKSGTLFDLPMALGILIAAGLLRPRIELENIIVIGELSLDGSLRPIHGALCIAAQLRQSQKTLFLPHGNVAEAQLVPDARIVGIESLKDLRVLESYPIKMNSSQVVVNAAATDWKNGRANDLWKEVKGQETAKRVMEIAAAGGHHALLIGPPGSGKTLLAKTLASLIEPLSIDEALEVSQVYSVAGLLSEEMPVIRSRPFRAPHHTITSVGLFGGGNPPRPGEVSLAHRGFLFLDEMPEFAPRVLEGLRQPLEDGHVVITRSGGTVRFPASFSLIAAANPCPCGFFGDPEHACICTEGALMRYRRRLSGPILDRMDLLLTVRRPRLEDVLGYKKLEETIEQVKTRIRIAAEIQRQRFGSSHVSNAHMTPQQIQEAVNLDSEGHAILKRGAQQWSLSPRAIHRVLRVARTIADLKEQKAVEAKDVAEALSYRLNPS